MLGRSRSARDLLLPQKLFLAPGISPEGGGTQLLLLLHPALGVQGQGILHGVHGEREGRANVEGKLEGHAMAGQCLAEIQTLDGQGGVAHSSHFSVLLNHELSGGTR